MYCVSVGLSLQKPRHNDRFEDISSNSFRLRVNERSYKFKQIKSRPLILSFNLWGVVAYPG